MSISEYGEDAYYALRNYFTDDVGSLLSMKTVLAGISVPALALAGHLLMTDAGDPGNVGQPIHPTDYGWLIDPVEGSATHANVSFSYEELQDPDKMVSNAMMQWSTVEETIPVASESQCVADGKDYITRMNQTNPGFAGSIDCMDGNQVVSQFQCVVKPVFDAESGQNKSAIQCDKAGLMASAERGADTLDIG